MQKNQEEFFYFILNHSQECIIKYDSKGCIDYCNDRLLELTGYSAGELIGVYIDELIQNVFHIVDNHIELVDEYKNTEVIETVLYRKNKTCFPVEIKVVSRVFDGVEVIVCTAVDMTRYKESIAKVEETTIQMQESMKARDAFVANVTHELRTPVNGIKGHAEIMIEQEQDFQKANYLKMILDCCSTMEGIINNILDFSKLEAGKFQIDEKPFSFYDFITKMEKMFNMLTMRKGLRFTLNVAQEIPDKVIGDELRLTQILNNLVSNAVKFTEQGYVGIEISLNTKINDEVELFFMVVDTGIGLSPEDKDKLFKSFSQADASITRKFGGTGLGLAITKELVTMMHGKVWADGEKGKGSTFSFTIRLKTEQAQDGAEQEHSIRKWKYSNNYNKMAGEQDLMYELGSDINIRELKKYFEKLNISMDMENWQKAESFATMLKQLLSGGTKDLQRLVFRMEMAIRKSDCDKARDYAEKVKEQLSLEIEGFEL
ncbi:MAG: PAS domain-containing protein [Lachnospiraceae bacterium]|nr:PAS domain-containing protein [Lachnospiraceae bacterium]